MVAANTFLPTGDSHPGDAFLAWQKFSQEVPEFPTGMIINGGCTTDLSPDVVAAYDAPFPGLEAGDDDHGAHTGRPIPVTPARRTLRR